MTGVAGFGPSALSTTPHLLAELGVPLDIPSGFASIGSPLPATGENGPPVTGTPSIPTGTSYGYSPDPAFWGASAVQGSAPRGIGGAGGIGVGAPQDPQAGAALFQIHPNGSVTASSDTLVTQQVNFTISKGGSKSDPIILHGDDHLKNNAEVTVTILSNATFDATTITLSSVRLGDPNDFDDAVQPIAEKTINNNGTVVGVELIFRGKDIREAVTGRTTDLELIGKTTDGTVFGGTEVVYVLQHDHELDGDEWGHHHQQHDPC
jgi:hypothetical protein